MKPTPTASSAKSAQSADWKGSLLPVLELAPVTPHAARKNALAVSAEVGGSHANEPTPTVETCGEVIVLPRASHFTAETQRRREEDKVDAIACALSSLALTSLLQRRAADAAHNHLLDFLCASASLR